MDDEEYGLTDEEKEYVKQTIYTKSARESKRSSVVSARRSFKKTRIWFDHLIDKMLM